MAYFHNAVMKRVGREQAQLDLDGRDGMHGVGPADGILAGLAQADAADLALRDELRQGRDRGLDRDVGVDPRAFEDVDGLDAGRQHLDSLLDGRADALGAAVGARLVIEGAFDAEDDPVGVLGVLLEVMPEQMQRVGLGGAVVYAL
jgi:hypothetical protein